jgi:flagellar basal body-associated protein FliL
MSLAHTAGRRRPPPQHHSPVRLLVAIIGVLATLVVLGLAGVTAIDRVVENRRVVAMMGPKGNFQTLPEMHFPLSGSRTLDLKVTLELRPKASQRPVERRIDRIEDRLYDGVRAIGEDQLVGPGSAERVKQAVKDAVNREAGRDLLKDVLIERMVLR